MSVTGIFVNIAVRRNTHARIFVNDLPLFHRAQEAQQFSSNKAINHFLVPEGNRLRLEVYEAESRGDRLAYDMSVDDGHDRSQNLIARFFREAREGDQNTVLLDADDEDSRAEMLAVLAFPDPWAPLPEPARVLPFVVEKDLEPGIDVAEPAWLGATPQDVPKDGTPELHAEIDKLHRAWATGDRDAAVDLMSLHVEEYAKAYGGGGGTSVGAQLADFDAMFQKPLDVPPLLPETLVFTERADKRVVEVTRLDRAPVLAAHAPDLEGFGMDLMYAFIAGRWQLI